MTLPSADLVFALREGLVDLVRERRSRVVDSNLTLDRGLQILVDRGDEEIRRDVRRVRQRLRVLQFVLRDLVRLLLVGLVLRELVGERLQRRQAPTAGRA